REEPVAAAVAEVQVRVDDDRDAADELVGQPLRSRRPLGVELGGRVDHPRVDEDEPVRMVDRVDEARPAATGEHDVTAMVHLDHVSTTSKSCHSPTPFRSARPTSRKRMPEPATRSCTVDDASTCPGSARDATRAAACTAIPRMASPTTSHSPVCTPARI